MDKVPERANIIDHWVTSTCLAISENFWFTYICNQRCGTPVTLALAARASRLSKSLLLSRRLVSSTVCCVGFSPNCLPHSWLAKSRFAVVGMPVFDCLSRLALRTVHCTMLACSLLLPVYPFPLLFRTTTINELKLFAVGRAL